MGIFLLIICLTCVSATIQGKITGDPLIAKNHLKFGFGTNFKYHGNLTHNLDRVWVVTAVEIPNFEERAKLDINPSGICRRMYGDLTSGIHADRGDGVMWPLRNLLQAYCNSFSHSYSMRKPHINHINSLVDNSINDLKTALPECFERSGTSATSTYPRHKRGIWGLLAGGLVTLATETVSWFIRRKRDKAVNKAIQRIDHNTQVTKGHVNQIDKDFAMYGKFDIETQKKILGELKRLDTKVKWQTNYLKTYLPAEFQKALREVRAHFEANNRQIMAVLNRIQQIRMYLMETLQVLEDGITMEEALLHTIRDFLRGVATLSEGRLSPDIISHSTLNSIVNDVKQMLAHSYPDYTVALDRLNNYYDMKLATFMVRPGKKEVLVSFPVFVKPKTVQSLALYEIETTYVPIPDLNQEANSYTRVIPQKPYIAIGNDSYIQLQIPELSNCKKINHQFYCEEKFLVKHNSKYTCEGALFYNLPDPMIKEYCEFEFKFNATVVPSILDGSTELVLANFRSPKAISCYEDNFVPKALAPAEHDYVKVNKSILCNCRIQGDLIEVLNSVSVCDGVNDLPPLKFTVNDAFRLYLPEMALATRSLNITSLVDLKVFEAKVNTTTEFNEQVYFPVNLAEETTDEDSSETLTELFANLDEMEKILARSPHRLHNTETQYQEVTVPPLVSYGMIVLASAVGLAAVLILFLACKYGHIKQLAMASLTTFAKVPPAQASGDYTDYFEHLAASQQPEDPVVTTLKFILNIVVVSGQLIFAAFVAYKIFKTCAWLKGYLFLDCVKLHLFLTDGVRYTSLHIRNMPGSPDQFITVGEIDPDNLNMQRNCWNDKLIINYRGYQFYHIDPQGDRQEVILPRTLQLGWDQKFKIRHLLKQPFFRAYIAVQMNDGWWSPHIDHPEHSSVTSMTRLNAYTRISSPY